MQLHRRKGVNMSKKRTVHVIGWVMKYLRQSAEQTYEAEQCGVRFALLTVMSPPHRTLYI